MNAVATALAEVTSTTGEDVEALSAIERRATTPGERRSAEWVADRLRDAGARDVRLTEYHGHSSWAPANAAHMGPRNE